jgi:transposase
MLMPMSHVKVSLFRDAVDMRWGYDRLAGLCQSVLGVSAHSGDLFVFLNRARDRMRIFYFDGSGSCLFSKRLEMGAFKIPDLSGAQGAASISASDLMLLIGGHQPMAGKKPRVWKPDGKDMR